LLQWSKKDRMRYMLNKTNFHVVYRHRIHSYSLHMLTKWYKTGSWACTSYILGVLL